MARVERNNPDDVAWAARNRSVSFLEEFPDHAKAIACLIAEYSAIEHRLATLAAAFMGNRKGVALPMIYAIESSRGRLEAIRAAILAVVRSIRPDSEAAMNQLVDETAKLLTQRNKYAHAVFGKNTRTGALMVLNPSNWESTELPLHDVQHQLKRMKDHSALVHQILAPVYEAMRKEPPATSPQLADAPPNQPGSDDAQSHPIPPGPPKPSQA